MTHQKKVIITGGAGFIGSAVIRQLINNSNYQIINVDKLTYAGDLSTLTSVSHDPRYRFEKIDICDQRAMSELFTEVQPDGIIHLAAESHVDRSIDGAEVFINTNIVGTFRLLEVVRDYLNKQNSEKAKSFRFHHVSTDEVYGSLTDNGYFTETSRYQPNSPYSASKAASDHLVRAWHETHKLPVLISNCSNNYGPYQFPEKLIPLMINKAINHEPLPVYGNGQNIRDWLYVEDHARALQCIFELGQIGEVYNVGGSNEVKNIDVVNQICQILDEVKPSANISSYKTLINFVKDRPGHDHRYAIDASKLTSVLGWQPRETFTSGLLKTINWYLANPSWSETLIDKYSGHRLGA